ncbi:putative hydroxybutyrate dehydrogenase [Periconia macrospinosa]|uniref:Putative hydroxybutyrate dehydrogenase n=1 Tax=Periconia macrospinosa TaxID=97972 RepID=A0A2V1D8D5_9PLEO|nr:putative hydroxybutyrate dehydrogenase [Periconia macrospinosa]
MTSKSVLITGCSDDGIGSGLALALHDRGYRVFATLRDPSKASKLKDVPNVTLLNLDVVEPAQIASTLEAVQRETGGMLDILINNAGHNRFMPILDENIEEVKALFDVNVFAPLAITKAFAPLLIKAKGSIVFITSISGYLNTPYMGSSAATKRAVEIMGETLRLEIAPFGVNVLDVVTGAVKTQGQSYFDNFTLPEGSLYKPIESTIANRAQGGDGVTRMSLEEYSVAVADAIINRTSGKFWYGENADRVKGVTTATSVPQSAMDAGVLMGTGLDALAEMR